MSSSPDVLSIYLIKIKFFSLIFVLYVVYLLDSSVNVDFSQQARCKLANWIACLDTLVQTMLFLRWRNVVDSTEVAKGVVDSWWCTGWLTITTIGVHTRYSLILIGASACHASVRDVDRCVLFTHVRKCVWFSKTDYSAALHVDVGPVAPFIFRTMPKKRPRPESKSSKSSSFTNTELLSILTLANVKCKDIIM